MFSLRRISICWKIKFEGFSLSLPVGLVAAPHHHVIKMSVSDTHRGDEEGPMAPLQSNSYTVRMQIVKCASVIVICREVAVLILFFLCVLFRYSLKKSKILNGPHFIEGTIIKKRFIGKFTVVIDENGVSVYKSE